MLNWPGLHRSYLHSEVHRVTFRLVSLHSRLSRPLRRLRRDLSLSNVRRPAGGRPRRSRARRHTLRRGVAQRCLIRGQESGIRGRGFGRNTNGSSPNCARKTSSPWAKDSRRCCLRRGWAKSLGLDDLWVKQCGVSHTGSFKDLGMTVLVSAVNQMMAGRGGVTPPLPRPCARSPARPPATPRPRWPRTLRPLASRPSSSCRGARSAPRSSSSRSPTARCVLALDTDFDGCMKIVQEVTRDNSIYLANSMNSLRVEGQKTVGIEIVQQLGWHVPDWIVLPSGNLGNISALAKGLALAKNAGRHRPAAAAGCGAGPARQPALPGVPALASTASSR